MKYLVIEMHGGPEYASIVTNEQGNNKVFDQLDEAIEETMDCQDGHIIEFP